MPRDRSWHLESDWLSKLVWPVAALVLLLLFNWLFTPGFFQVEVRCAHLRVPLAEALTTRTVVSHLAEHPGEILTDVHLYGTLIDILNHGAKVMLLALGMTLVIATGGVDLSVGAVMAIAGAVAAQLIHAAGVPFPVVIAAALGISLAAGAWNGMLVGLLRIQPIVATLILMVAGRGVAQLIADGQIITFTDERLVYVGNGHLLGLPFPVAIVAVALAATVVLTRKTAVGLFIESVGDNETATRYSGVNARVVKFMAYVFSGLCAGFAGLVAASNIKCADSNHAGLFLELDAILAVVVGGTALTGGRFYLLGSVAGALLIQALTTTMYMRDVSPDIAPVPKALVIVAVCLLQSETFRKKAAALVGRRPA
ncbi:MAG TPA: ABC transporter permease [Phycisphaerae bacterium]|nr:ABC transporter permease [Phycisphaerae bacterium]